MPGPCSPRPGCSVRLSLLLNKQHLPFPCHPRPLASAGLSHRAGQPLCRPAVVSLPLVRTPCSAPLALFPPPWEAVRPTQTPVSRREGTEPRRPASSKPLQARRHTFKAEFSSTPNDNWEGQRGFWEEDARGAPPLDIDRGPNTVRFFERVSASQIPELLPRPWDALQGDLTLV